MFHGSDCQGYRGSSAAGSSERFIAGVLIWWKEYLLLGVFSFQCRKSPAEISHVDLQEKSLLAAMGAGVLPPLLHTFVLSGSSVSGQMFSPSPWELSCFQHACSGQSDTETGKNFSPHALILLHSPQIFGKEGSVVIGGGVSGRQPGQKCFAVEQSWAIDPASTLALNLEIWRHKTPFWYINLIFCISQDIQPCSLNQFWTKYFYLAGSMAGRSSFLAKRVIFKEIWDWSVGASCAFYRQRSSSQVLFVWFCPQKAKYIDL